MLWRLKFRHGAPIALWHVGHPQLGILPFPDGNGIIKPLPQQTVMRLGFIGRRHLKIRQRANYRLAGSIEKRLVMGAVIDEKGFVLISGTKMLP